jgi:hypothetical protein
MDAAAPGIGGGVGPSQGGPGHVTVFAEIDDLDATLEDAERLGGKRIADPIEFPDKRPSAHGRGSVRFTYFADPEGQRDRPLPRDREAVSPLVGDDAAGAAAPTRAAPLRQNVRLRAAQTFIS